MTKSREAPQPNTHATAGTWSHLFSREYRSAVVVLASGVGLYAMNLYFTAALLPSVVADIGGAKYYAWVATSYLIAAVVATMLVSRLLSTIGAARTYVLAYGVFGLGTAGLAVSLSMELFVAGRAVQGLGAGLLTGLGYAVIRGVLPQALWTRATGLISAMFGVGTLFGPALGGLFAGWGAWRMACGGLAVLALALIPVAVRALPGGRPEKAKLDPVPVWSIATLAATAAVLSVSSTLSGWLVPVALGAGLLLLAGFFVLDARHVNGVLPRLAYTRGNPLKWVYLTVAALCAGVTIENFIPLFAQNTGGATPLIAGLVGAVMSLGWTSAQLFSVNATGETVARLVRIAPWVLTAGLVGYGLLQIADPGPGVIVAWAAVLLFAGAGVGIAFPHLSVAAMSSSTDEREGAKAAAAVSTTQLIAFTLTSALAGNLMALGATDSSAARWLIYGIAVLTAMGIFTSFAATRRVR